MKHRGPLAVFFLSLFTLGIYAFVWHVKTKGELNRLGADIPTAWLLIVPFANLYWLWKYSEGVEKVTGGKISAVMAIIMLLLLSIVGIAILQSMYNGLGTVQAASVEPAQAGPQPDGTQSLAPSGVSAQPVGPLTNTAASPQDATSQQLPPQPPAPTPSA